MKFITEDELRYLYRKEPFTTYEAEPGTRLTPGARQFLLDRGVDMYDEKKKPPIIRDSLTQEVCCPSANPNHNGGGYGNPAQAAAPVPTPSSIPVSIPVSAPNHIPVPAPAAAPNPTPSVEPKMMKKCNWRTKMVKTKLASVEALFLKTEESLLGTDVMIAQSLSQLCKQFTDIRHMVEGKGTAMNLPCKEGYGITCENFSEDVDDCFEITEFHVHLEKGKQIIELHQLRCALREIEPVMLQAFEGNSAATGPCMDAIGKINQIINTVSQLICGAVGGQEWQRKM